MEKVQKHITIDTNINSVNYIPTRDAHGDFNGITFLPETPLTLAIQLNHREIIATLIDAGADLNLPVNGNSPLIAAVKLSCQEIITILLNAGANVNPIIGIAGAPPSSLQPDMAAQKLLKSF